MHKIAAGKVPGNGELPSSGPPRLGGRLACAKYPIHPHQTRGRAMHNLALAILLAAPLPAAAQGCAGVADTAVMLIEGGWTAHSGGHVSQDGWAGASGAGSD